MYQQDNRPPTQYPAAPSGPPIFYKNPSVAVVLSCLWAGLGQLYNGQMGKGIAFIFIYGICLASIVLYIGYVTTPIVWIWGMVDAYSSANKINQRLHRQTYNGQ